jgi:hypothetical protein
MKPKTGDIVECVFLDHVEDGGEPICFIVWGRLHNVTREHYEIVSWSYAKSGADDLPSNEKRWSIVRAAVKRFTKLLPA